MDDEILIELVRKRPVLYDTKDGKYLNAEWKGRMWNQIGQKMNIDSSQCKARWNNIRDNFRKSLIKRRTRSGLGGKKIKPYRFEKQLQFLRSYMEERDAKENSEHGDPFYGMEQKEILPPANVLHSSETSSQPVYQPSVRPKLTISNETPSSTIAFSKHNRVVGKKNIQPETSASPILSYALERNEERTNSNTASAPTVTMEHPIDCFLFGISSTLKSFSPYLQHLAKSEIFTTVQKLELQMLQSQQIDVPRIQTVNQTSYPPDTSFEPQEPMDDNSSFHEPKCIIEY